LVTSCTTTAGRHQTPSVAERLVGTITDDLHRQGLNNVRAVLVVANDRTVVEQYYHSTPTAYFDVRSVTKSVLSTLVGIAVDEGLLDLHGTLAELLPAYAPTMSPQVATTTLDQLLTMTGGFPDTPNEELFTQPDWVASILRSAVSPPGQEFAYSDRSAHLVAAILAHATRQSVLQYAREKLFGPLGIPTEPAAEPLFVPSNGPAYEAAGFAWPVDPQGIHLGWGLLKLRPPDMATIGGLFLHEGRWKNHQVVSKSWVGQATSARVPAHHFGLDSYGYLWWVAEADGAPAYLALGSGGQLIEVVPSRHLVVAIASEIPDNSAVPDSSLLPELVANDIAPAFR
jgi:CubicO group peptidase (beta-lactamase class C family)